MDQSLEKGSLRDHHRSHPAAALELDIIQNPKIQRVGHGQTEAPWPFGQGEDSAFPGQLWPDGLGCLGLTPEGWFLIGKAQLNREGLGHGFFLHPSPMNQKGSQAEPAAYLFGQSPVKDFRRDGS